MTGAIDAELGASLSPDRLPTQQRDIWPGGSFPAAKQRAVFEGLEGTRWQVVTKAYS